MELAQIFILLLSFFFILLLILIFLYIFFIMRSKKEETNDSFKDNIVDNKDNKTKNQKSSRGSIYDFMEFDEIRDNMIIRKNRSQYVMVVKCKGVNYDLMSEEEKISVEAGFVQFLNTLRFPIQLYIQTTSLNLRDIIEEYKNRIKNIQKDVRKIDEQINVATLNDDSEKINKLSFEKRRLENVLEYGVDISDYIARMSANKNILQQKTYLVISYYTAEIETTENLAKEEIDNICFSELYTRTQTAIRALGSSGVIGKILDSEELSELLYAAYNRDESEIIQLSKALDAEYDALYSTGKDVLKKKQEVLEETIEREALELAANSIRSADEEIKKQEKISEKALEIIEEYKTQMDEEIYNKTKDKIKKTSSKEKSIQRTVKKIRE